MEVTINQALAIWQNHLCILPAMANEKRPAVAWKPFQTQFPTEDFVRAKFPASRCCIVCGKVSGNLEILDFDQAGAAFDTFRKLVPAKLMARLVLEKTPSKGYHCIYRCEEAVDGNRKLAMGYDGSVLIETRGEGGLFLCSPSEGYELLQGDWATVPTLTREERNSLHGIAHSLNQFQPTGRTNSSEVSPEVFEREGVIVSPVEDFNLRGDARPFLQKAGWNFFCQKGDTEEWTRPGKATGCSATLRKVDGKWLFHNFSSNSPVFEPNQSYNFFQIYALLEHAGDESSAVAALKKEGFGLDEEPPNYDYLLQAETKQQVVVNAYETSTCDGSEESDEVEEDSQTSDEIPEEWLRVPGFIGALVQFINETAYRKQPAFALATALCAQSVLTHQKYCGCGGIRANIYCLIVGGTGCGKDYGREVLKKLFEDLQCSGIIRESYQSFPALQNDLRYGYCPKLLLWDEFGRALQAMNAKTASTYHREIQDGLMKLYTSATSTYTPAIKADIGSNPNQYNPIPNPFVTLLGTATPDQLLKNLASDVVTDGFLGRTFVFNETRKPADLRMRETPEILFPDQILYMGQRLAQPLVPTETDFPIANNYGIQAVEGTKPPVTQPVEMEEDAKNLLHQYILEIDEKRTSRHGDLWMRTVEHANKLALLYAVSQAAEIDDASPKITLSAMHWAIALANHFAAGRVAQAEEWVADSQFEAMQKELLRYVKKQGGVLTKTAIQKRFWGWTKDDREKILTNLVETGRLFEYRKKSQTNAATVYSTKRQCK